MMEVRAGHLHRKEFRQYLQRNGIRFEEDKYLPYSTFFIQAGPLERDLIRTLIQIMKESS